MCSVVSLWLGCFLPCGEPLLFPFSLSPMYSSLPWWGIALPSEPPPPEQEEKDHSSMGGGRGTPALSQLLCALFLIPVIHAF